MPVLESTDEITPRSALRHRPIGGGADQTPQQNPATNAVSPVAQRASRPRQHRTETQDRTETREKDEDEVAEWQRVENEEERPPHAAGWRTTAASRSLPKKPASKGMPTSHGLLSRGHPLLYLGLGMLAMLALWTLLSFLFSWWNTTLDDIRYGRPRTFQVDAVVGHNDSAASPSHFIAINLNGRIDVIEMPGGDASHARIYLGPQLYDTGDNLTPVTLSFLDVNGDHKPDMIVHFKSSEIVFINDGGGFRPLRPDEQHTVEQFLRDHGQ